MKRLDDSTIEVIAEAICGQGEGAGGGYTAPGPYRTKTQICDFFRRAGVDPQGMSSTRKWFVLESLQAIKGTPQLDSVLTYVQRLSKDRSDGDTCRICWQVVRAAVADLLEVDKQSGGAAQL
jgi:hypothetical protein